MLTTYPHIYVPYLSTIILYVVFTTEERDKRTIHSAYISLCLWVWVDCGQTFEYCRCLLSLCMYSVVSSHLELISQLPAPSTFVSSRNYSTVHKTIHIQYTKF